MLLNSRYRHIKELPHLRVSPAIPVDQEHRHPLPLRQERQRRWKSRLNQRLTFSRDDRQQWPGPFPLLALPKQIPTLATAHRPQVSGWILHIPNLPPPLPAIQQGLRNRIPGEIRAHDRYQGVTQHRLIPLDKQRETLDIRTFTNSSLRHNVSKLSSNKRNSTHIHMTTESRTLYRHKSPMPSK
jgi:hypothetical protein